jgi:enoyl-CoA hydratase/carnithine racemase
MTNEQPPVVLQSRHVLPISGKEVVIVSINRPTQLNCFNIDVCYALASIFRSLRDEQDENVAAIILTGEGTSFCAGADLSDPPSPIIMSSDLPHHLEVNPVHQMSLMQVPIIGALKGYVSRHGVLMEMIALLCCCFEYCSLTTVITIPCTIPRSLRVALNWL